MRTVGQGAAFLLIVLGVAPAMSLGACSHEERAVGSLLNAGSSSGGLQLGQEAARPSDVGSDRVWALYNAYKEHEFQSEDRVVYWASFGDAVADMGPAAGAALTKMLQTGADIGIILEAILTLDERYGTNYFRETLIGSETPASIRYEAAADILMRPRLGSVIGFLNDVRRDAGRTPGERERAVAMLAIIEEVRQTLQRDGIPGERLNR